VENVTEIEKSDDSDQRIHNGKSTDDIGYNGDKKE
jgi:hypothetical protein